ncbi:hypothetical protein PL9214220002 [Planktothrix tepida PCC 9214]|uniref:Uncharacterized protein n=1 Tax=Planktothrix tepida PCC 9214 TaxID=671072 RepID=A0A1J1LCD9_9CYAN|nr:hypothetical protein PL9214220002 [Planktothrix tepida PCC 9214]
MHLLIFWGDEQFLSKISLVLSQNSGESKVLEQSLQQSSLSL